MAGVSDGIERRPRWGLFLRTQSPVAASTVMVLALVFALGVQIDHPLRLIVGVAVLALATLVAIVVPWQRLHPAAHGAIAALDLVGIVVLATALQGRIETVSALAAVPAIWLGAALGWRGAAVGIVGLYAASIAPLLVNPGPYTAVEWASALVIPIVMAVIVGVAVLAGSGVRASFAARDAAANEAERFGAAMRSFFDDVDLGLTYLDESGESVLFNQAIVDFGRLAQHDAGDAAGTRVFAADQVTPLAPEDQPLARVRRGERFTDFRYWVGPRGGQRALLASGRPVLRSDGRPAGMMLVVQDATDLLRANRAREDALATLAHELRTPLTSIVGYSELLSMDDLGPEAAARLEVITRNADHLLALTARFLDDLHPGVDLHRQRVAVRSLVDDALTVLHATPGFAERGVHVDVDDALQVLADPEAITAVLTNLLSNAAKFSSAGDRITIVAGEDDAWVSLVVTNAGPRIDTEDLERIFDRFYRGVNAQRDAVAGTGIGLSVSRQIAIAHGGTLIAEAVDEGASFKLCLPRG